MHSFEVPPTDKQKERTDVHPFELHEAEGHEEPTVPVGVQENVEPDETPSGSFHLERETEETPRLRFRFERETDEAPNLSPSFEPEPDEAPTPSSDVERQQEHDETPTASFDHEPEPDETAGVSSDFEPEPDQAPNVGPDVEPDTDALHNRTRTDSLTGLPNLMMLDSFLWLQVQQRMRHELPGYLGVIMLNVDRLGRINDALGGNSTEDVVRAFGAVLAQATRDSDFLVRYSGGTFCLAISHTTPDSLALAGERLRAYIERHPIDLGDSERWNVTASFGCAWLPDVHDPVDPVLGLLDVADAQLQKAQAAGGNRVAVAAVPTTSTTTRPSEDSLPESGDELIPTPTETAELLAVLPDEDRAAWATVFYAGLRPGELVALRDEDVDLEAGVLRVQRTWDRRKHAGKAKKRSRTVPIVAALRPHLVAHTLRRGGSKGTFLGTAEQPLDPGALVHRAAVVWREAGLTPLGLGDARDAFAKLLVDARVNVQTISALLGHASVAATLARYGHLMPGTEDETVLLVDAYLQRVTTAHQLGAVAQAQ